MESSSPSGPPGNDPPPPIPIRLFGPFPIIANRAIRLSDALTLVTLHVPANHYNGFVGLRRLFARLVRKEIVPRNGGPGTKDTPIELALERAFQGRSNLHGLHHAPLWRKQEPIGPYKADFYFAEVKLVVEADGAFWHDRPQAQLHDDHRDTFMAEQGIVVLRFPGWQCLKEPARIAFRIEKVIHALRIRARSGK